MSDKPRDVLGNTLSEGDWVAVKVDAMLVGKVVRIQEGGIIHPSDSNKQTANIAVLGFEMNIPYARGTIITNTVKIVNPNSEKLVEEAVKKNTPGPRLA